MHLIPKRLRAAFAALLGLGLVVGLMGAPTPARADLNLFESDPFLPEGVSNLARDKQATSSSAYHWTPDGWHTNMINDGRVGEGSIPYGWTTDVGTADTETTPAWVQLDLATPSSVEGVALWPRLDQLGANFPVDYTFEVSMDALNWTPVVTSTGNTTVTEAQVFSFEAVEARHVRVHVTRRAPAGRDGALVQLTELAVYGNVQQAVGHPVDKPALELLPGEADTIHPMTDGVPGDPATLQWSSADPGVASVVDGMVTAVAVGSTTVTATPAVGAPVVIPVDVVAQRVATDSELMISAFWPPTAAHSTPEQYDLLAAAHIDYVQNVDSTDLQGREANLAMAAMAAERGMRVGVADPRLNNSLDLDDAEVRAIVASWKNIPGVGGFYLKDEPFNANPYAPAHRAVKDEAPWLYPYLNFFNMFVYPDRTTYESQMDDYLELAGTDEVDYLIYDLYPFGNAPDTLAYHDMLNNMDSVRTVGLENDVKTGIYLQSIGRINADGTPAGFRRTNGNEIRYEVNAALALGFKQLSYFTWFTPTGRPELFTDAIIAPDGTPTDLYEPVKQLNSEVKALGPTLVGLDSLEFYVHGPDQFQQEPVPTDFVAQLGADDNVLVSRLVDRESGRQYLMLVNNDFRAGQSIELQLDGITAVEEVSRVDGSSTAHSAADGSFTFDLDIADAVLLRLPADTTAPMPAVPGDNLAAGANATAATSEGSNGWYLDKLTDGIRFSESGSNGWRALDVVAGEPTEVELDLRSERSFNRVDVYPAGNQFGYGNGFPGHVVLDVSTDGQSWTQVADQDIAAPYGETAPSITFDRVDARYLRFSFTDHDDVDGEPALRLSEFEVFDDDGSLPAPENFADRVEDEPWEEGKNLALNRPHQVSSSYEAAIWGWSSAFVVDGEQGEDARTNGWTSDLNRHETEEGVEWVAVHLGGPYLLDEVVVHPRNAFNDRANAGLGFPTDYQVETSMDGENWTTVKVVTGDVEISAEPRTIAFDEPVEAAYVRFLATRLKVSQNARDGYQMQIGELQAYGTPADGTTPEPTEEPSEEPTPDPSEEPTVAPSPEPTPEPTEPTGPYLQPGLFNINGRWWVTVCEPYSQTTRCRTDIWATTVSQVGGKFVQRNGWVFNNFTYLPKMTQAQWATNPLGFANSWTDANGRAWRTECNTPATGSDGCRTYVHSDVIAATPAPGGGYTHAWTKKWVFNNMVVFRKG